MILYSSVDKWLTLVTALSIVSSAVTCRKKVQFVTLREKIPVL